jgi:hypothetical protein
MGSIEIESANLAHAHTAQCLVRALDLRLGRDGNPTMLTWAPDGQHPLIGGPLVASAYVAEVLFAKLQAAELTARSRATEGDLGYVVARARLAVAAEVERRSDTILAAYGPGRRWHVADTFDRVSENGGRGVSRALHARSRRVRSRAHASLAPDLVRDPRGRRPRRRRVRLVRSDQPRRW